MQVRNAGNAIVQPEYGDDGMDPVAMEGKKGEPVALLQKLSIVKAMTPKGNSSELAPLPAEFRSMMEEEMAAVDSMSASNGAAEFCSPAFKAALHGFLEDKVQSCMSSICNAMNRSAELYTWSLKSPLFSWTTVLGS